jgi:voltage-gated potassium channel
VISTDGLIDLISVLPFWFAFVLPSELRIILLFRIVRFLKLARYSPALRSLLETLYAEQRALFGCSVIMAGATLISATFIHLAEREAQPDKFGTIPDAMWWSIVTLGTIGYGDVVPITPLGKFVAAMTILWGLVMIAQPVGIVATAFSEQIHRRDFVVTWGMVARVPLFSGLDAAAIVDITRLLRAQTVEAGELIVRRGDRGHSMYFIARGEVGIDLNGKHIRLGVGHFFRRDRGAAASATLCQRDGYHQDQSACARRQRFSCTHGTGAADRCASECCGVRPRWPRGGLAERRHRGRRDHSRDGRTVSLHFGSPLYVAFERLRA